MELEPEMEVFLHGGCTLIVGLTFERGEPFATRGWGATVLHTAGGDAPADSLGLRLLVDAAEELAVDLLGSGCAVALTARRRRHPAVGPVQGPGHGSRRHHPHRPRPRRPRTATSSSPTSRVPTSPRPSSSSACAQRGRGVHRRDRRDVRPDARTRCRRLPAGRSTLTGAAPDQVAAPEGSTSATFERCFEGGSRPRSPRHRPTARRTSPTSPGSGWSTTNAWPCRTSSSRRPCGTSPTTRAPVLIYRPLDLRPVPPHRRLRAHRTARRDVRAPTARRRGTAVLRHAGRVQVAHRRHLPRERIELVAQCPRPGVRPGAPARGRPPGADDLARGSRR